MSGEGSLGDRLQKILLLIRQLSDTYGKSPDNPTVIRTVTVYVQELEVAFEKVIGVIGSEETNAADEDLLRKEGGEGGDGTGNSAERRLEGAGSDDGSEGDQREKFAVEFRNGELYMGVKDASPQIDSTQNAEISERNSPQEQTDEQDTEQDAEQDAALSLCQLSKTDETDVDMSQSTMGSMAPSSGSPISPLRLGSMSESFFGPGKTPVKCLICEEILVTTCDLTKHYRQKHSEMVQFTCDICDEKFQYSKQLYRHKKKCHSGRIPKIKIKIKLEGDGKEKENEEKEDKELPERDEEENKKVEIQSKGSYICTTCNTHFKSIRSYSVHCKSGVCKNADMELVCAACHESFNTYLEMQEHRKHCTFKLPCEQCGKLFKDSTTLGVHLKRHANPKPFKCKECGKSFMDKWSHTKHVKRHSPERPYVCDVCNKAYVSEQDLLTHSKYHSTDAFPCEVCGKIFNHKKTLWNHMLRHKGDRQHVCSTCGKAFYTSTALTIHIRSHTGEKVVSCEICGKGFSAKNCLKKHMITHSDEKPHMCNECGKSFSRRDNLKQHLLTHSGEKSYMCEMCGKGFDRKKKMELHMESQHGKPPPAKDDGYKPLVNIPPGVGPGNQHGQERVHHGRILTRNQPNNGNPSVNRTQLESGNQYENRNQAENRNQIESRGQLENRTQMENRNIMESRGQMENGNQMENRNIMEHRNHLESRMDSENRNLLDNRHDRAQLQNLRADIAQSLNFMQAMQPMYPEQGIPGIYRNPGMPTMYNNPAMQYMYHGGNVSSHNQM